MHAPQASVLPLEFLPALDLRYPYAAVLLLSQEKRRPADLVHPRQVGHGRASLGFA
jgi:hypothetical protein